MTWPRSYGKKQVTALIVYSSPTGCGTLEQHHLLAAARPDRLCQAAADPELGCQRRGDLRERGGDQDGVVGGTLGQSAAAVAGEHLRAAGAVPGQVPPRLVRRVRPALDADHAGGHAGQQGGLEAQAGADLEHVVAAVRVQAPVIRAGSDGCVVTCRCPSGMGSSR
jgi:hypothetical protein